MSGFPQFLRLGPSTSCRGESNGLRLAACRERGDQKSSVRNQQGSRGSRQARMPQTGWLGRGLATAAVVVAGLFAGSLDPTKAQAEVGWHQPALVDCYESGFVTLQPRMAKIRNFDQYLGYTYQLYSYATGRWQWLVANSNGSPYWYWHHVGVNEVFAVYLGTGRMFKITPPGAYYIRTTYAWWAGGYTLGQASDHTTTYGYGQGDYVGSYQKKCYPYHAFTSTVGDNYYCTTFFLGCAGSASVSKRPHVTKRRWNGTYDKRWHGKKNGQRWHPKPVSPPPAPPSVKAPAPTGI